MLLKVGLNERIRHSHGVDRHIRKKGDSKSANFHTKDTIFDIKFEYDIIIIKDGR
jgi:hypothetical protein